MKEQKIHKAGLLCLEEGKLLIVYKEKLGAYITLGGKLKPPETDEECLQREVLEEIGCKVNDLSYFNRFISDALEQRCYFGKLGGIITLNQDDSITGYCWIDKNYRALGIALAPMLEYQIIPKLIAMGLL